MPDSVRAWRPTGGGVALRIRLTPRASKDAVTGLDETAQGPAVLVRVRAVPDQGEANAAAATTVAGWLGVPGSRVKVARGHKSRVKTLEIGGDPGMLERLIAARVEALAEMGQGER
jgi:uncharacterized protein YggU (UPF0235/DUF167 family)